MRRLYWLAAFVLVLASCEDGGVVGTPFDTTGIQDAGDDAIRILADGRLPDQGEATDVVVPDTPAPELTDQVEQPDNPSGPDGTGEDTPIPDGGGDTGPAPYVPFGPCSKTQPCPSKLAPLCLILPDSDEGICVAECSQDSDCAPWYTCQKPDPNNDELKVCLESVEILQPCGNKDGKVCKDGTYCLEPPDGGQPLCTTFCTPGESICPKGTTCTVMDPEDPTWGACMIVPDFAGCTQSAECTGDDVCVELAEGTAHCMPECDAPGLACGSFDTCVAVDLADGGSGGACLTVQGQGAICAPLKGLVCADGLHCTDLQAPDGWHRCLANCTDGQCEPGYLCQPVANGAPNLCIPLALAMPELQSCNQTWFCPTGQLCIYAPDSNVGVCAAVCTKDEDCDEGLTCHNGGCVLESPVGGSCLTSVGVFCDDVGECLRDANETGPGYCGQPCVPGETECPAEQECLAATPATHACLQPAEYGQLCSLDDGITCTNPGACLKVQSDQDFGFCSLVCEGPGSCPQDIPGAYAECMIQKAGQWYCAFLCGDWGECPEGMTCSGLNMCR